MPEFTQQADSATTQRVQAAIMLESHSLLQKDGRTVCGRCDATAAEMDQWCSRRLKGRAVNWPPKFLQLVGDGTGVVVGAMSPVIVYAKHSGTGRRYPVSIDRVVLLVTDEPVKAPEAVDPDVRDETEF